MTSVSTFEYALRWLDKKDPTWHATIMTQGGPINYDEIEYNVDMTDVNQVQLRRAKLVSDLLYNYYVNHATDEEKNFFTVNEEYPLGSGISLTHSTIFNASDARKDGAPEKDVMTAFQLQEGESYSKQNFINILHRIFKERERRGDIFSEPYTRTAGASHRALSVTTICTWHDCGPGYRGNSRMPVLKTSYGGDYPKEIVGWAHVLDTTTSGGNKKINSDHDKENSSYTDQYMAKVLGYPGFAIKTVPATEYNSRDFSKPRNFLDTLDLVDVRITDPNSGEWENVDFFTVTKGNKHKDFTKGSLFGKSEGDDSHATGLTAHVAYEALVKREEVTTGLTCDGALFSKWYILKKIFKLSSMQAIYSQNAKGSGKLTQVLVLPATVNYDEQLNTEYTSLNKRYDEVKKNLRTLISGRATLRLDGVELRYDHTPVKYSKLTMKHYYREAINEIDQLRQRWEQLFQQGRATGVPDLEKKQFLTQMRKYQLFPVIIELQNGSFKTTRTGNSGNYSHCIAHRETEQQEIRFFGEPFDRKDNNIGKRFSTQHMGGSATQPFRFEGNIERNNETTYFSIDELIMCYKYLETMNILEDDEESDEMTLEQHEETTKNKLKDDNDKLYYILNSDALPPSKFHFQKYDDYEKIKKKLDEWGALLPLNLELYSIFVTIIKEYATNKLFRFNDVIIELERQGIIQRNNDKINILYCPDQRGHPWGPGRVLGSTRNTREPSHKRQRVHKGGAATVSTLSAMNTEETKTDDREMHEGVSSLSNAVYYHYHHNPDYSFENNIHIINGIIYDFFDTMTPSVRTITPHSWGPGILLGRRPPALTRAHTLGGSAQIKLNKKKTKKKIKRQIKDKTIKQKSKRIMKSSQKKTHKRKYQKKRRSKFPV